MKVYYYVKKAMGYLKAKKKKGTSVNVPESQPGYLIGDYMVILGENVSSVLKNYIQDELHKNEAGGILLGSLVGKTIYVIKASVPNIFDKATRTSFIRDKDIAQIIVDYEFENSGGKMFYLGEWHTHPEDNPTPSGQDKKMTIEQFNKSRLPQPFSLMIIQGIKGIYIALFDAENILEPSSIVS
jgi:integrative and conjugative element protein (TIGR02256 family)